MLASYYEGQALVTVAPLEKTVPGWSPTPLPVRTGWRSPCADTESRHCSPPGLTTWAGVAAAAVQNLNLMLGFPETEGLDLSVPERP